MLFMISTYRLQSGFVYLLAYTTLHEFDLGRDSCEYCYSSATCKSRMLILVGLASVILLVDSTAHLNVAYTLMDVILLLL